MNDRAEWVPESEISQPSTVAAHAVEEEVIAELYGDEADDTDTDAAPQTVQPAAPEHPEPPDETKWTDADLQDLTSIQAARTELQAGHAAWMKQYGHIDIAELEKTDRARAAQVRVDAREAWAKLQQLDQQITAAAQTLTERVQQRQLERVKAYRDREFQKMIKAAPELKDEATRAEFRKWLVTDYGYTEQEILSAMDSRSVLLAYRAYRAANPKPERKVSISKYRKPKANGRPLSKLEQRNADLARMYGHKPAAMPWDRQQQNSTALVTEHKRAKSGDDVISILYGGK